MPSGPVDPRLTRRDLLKSAGLAGAAIIWPDAADAATPQGPAVASRRSMIGVPFERHDTVRVAIVGTGLRGSSVLGEFLSLDNVRVTALCDIVPEKAQRNAKMVTDTGQPAPALYTGGEHDFEQLVARDDIDFVYTATPWQWHTPVCSPR